MMKSWRSLSAVLACVGACVLARGPSYPDCQGSPATGDEDGDGVCANLDACPGTANGATVDATGCAANGPVDTDTGDEPSDTDDTDETGDTADTDDSDDLTPAGQADILVIMDLTVATNEDWPQRLAEEREELLASLDASDVDYRIGVTTDDLTSPLAPAGGLVEVDGVRWVDRQTANAPSVLRRMLLDGEDKSGRCQVARAIEAALDPTNTANVGFIRDAAALHVLIMSDQRDLSYDQQDSDAGENADGFIDWLNAIKTDPGVARSFSAIAGPPMVGCSDGTLTGAEPGAPWDRYVDEIGPAGGAALGVYLSICEEDYEAHVHELSSVFTQTRF